MHTPHTREDAPASNPALAAQDRYRPGWTRGRSFGCIALAVLILLYATSLYGQGSDNALFIDQKGNVGIGTTDPQGKLDVRDQVYVRSLRFADPANGQPYPDNWIGMADKISGTTKWLHIGGITDGEGAEKKRRLVLYADTTHVSGNVGIGTTSPKQKLHVAGDYYGKGHLWLHSYAGDGKSGTALVQARDDSNTSSLALLLRTQKEGKVVDTMMLTADGKVGIGTTDPQGKLDVRDRVHVQSLSFTDPNGQPYPDNWIGMADNVSAIIGGPVKTSSNTKWLHIGGVTDGTDDAKKRRLALFADITLVNNDLWVHGKVWNRPNLAKWGWVELTSPQGDNHYASWVSDVRLKADVHPIPTALEKVSQLRGVTYRWNQEAFNHFTRDLAQTISAGPEATAEEQQQHLQAVKEKIIAQHVGRQMGLIAQDVESVLPEVVTTDAAGYKAIKYPLLTAVLIEAVKEQQALIAAQRADIARLQASNDALQAHVQELQAHSAAARATQAELADIRAQLAHLGAAVQRVTATRQASATEVGRVIVPRQ